MTTLARQMETRSHDVVLSSFPDTEGFARAGDLPFVPLCEKEYPVGSMAKLLEPLTRLQGRAAMEYTFQLLADVLQNEIIDFPHMLAACQADAVVLDEADTYLSLVPMHLQVKLLESSTLCVTHAGLNTALECLTQGVPMVAIPITNDQPGVAARIAEKKAGLVVALNDLTASRLSLLVDQVLNDSTYRDNARYFQKVIAETNGLSKATDLLERAFGLDGRPRQDDV